MIEQTVDDIGTIRWFKNGIIHRDDGPAVIHPNMVDYWYQNGLLHRDNAPAIECHDGSKGWYQNGKLHREDGPAVIWDNGLVEYWLNDVQMTEIEYFVKIGSINE